MMKTSSHRHTALIVAFAGVVLLLVAGDGWNDYDSRQRNQVQGERIDANKTEIAELVEEMRLLREAIEKLNQDTTGGGDA